MIENVINNLKHILYSMNKLMKQTRITSLKVGVFLIGLVLILPIINSIGSNIIQEHIENDLGSSNEIMSNPTGWSEDLRLTYAINLSRDGDIIADGDIIYVVWNDYRTGSYEVYFKKSNDGGMNWSLDFKISTGPPVMSEPKIGVNGSQIHVVWEAVDITREVHYRNSTDYGETWNPEVRLSENDGKWSYVPDMCVVGNQVHVVWVDRKNADDPDIYYRNSTNGGLTWNPEQRLTDHFGTEGGVHVGVNDSNIHIVFTRWLSKNEVFYMNSTDSGMTWSPEQQLTPNDGSATDMCSIAIWQDNVHILYRDGIEGSDEVYYINSTDGGISWNPSRRISDLPNYSSSSDIFVDKENVYTVWQDDRDNSSGMEIYYAYSNDSGGNWSNNIRLTFNYTGAGPTISVNDSVIHVVWYDLRDGNAEIYYKRSPDFPPDPTYNITLNQGWNLISIPLEQSDESLDQVLQNITGKWNYILTYNSTNSDKWKTNNTFRPDQLNDLKTLNHKVAFWINITEPGGCNLTVSGTIPVSTTIPLYAGWNLVGYPTQTTETVGNALWGTGADRVEVYNATAPYQVKEVGPSYVMKPGEGYWIHVVADSVWVVDW